MKTIVIIGGGISGLATLHYLNQRFGQSARITLYERNNHVGGNIHTIAEEGFLFELGPNGFLSNQPTTLAFINELGLNNQLVEANAKAKKRYVQVKGRLEAFPSDPISFTNFQPFSYLDHLRLMAEFLMPKRDNSKETVEEFVRRRCGQKTADFLIDPFVSGVFAGDIKRLHMASAFPKMVAMENEYGSLIKALIARKKQGIKPAVMHSFVKGMGQLIYALADKYKGHIKTSVPIESIDDVIADHKIIAAPAYTASRILNARYPLLAKDLDDIVYAPIVVAGFGFAPGAFKRKPKGFGYLVPSNQRKEVLGVLIESHVFPNRAPIGQVMLRVMLGGRHHPQVANDDPKDLINQALKELNSIYGLKESPICQWVKVWPKAIPQYETHYPHLRQSIRAQLNQIKGLSLVGNYLDGISFNDSIHFSRQQAYALEL